MTRSPAVRVDPAKAIRLALPLAATLAILSTSTPCLAEGSAPPPAKAGAVTKESSLQRIRRMVARINIEAATPEGEAAVVNRLSRHFAVPPEVMRRDHQSWGLGYGEIAMAYGFARASRKPVTAARIVEMRRSGMEWEAIARDLGVKVDAVASRMRKQVGPKPKPQTS